VRKLWRNYNLSLVLAGLFALSLALQTWMGWERFAGEQQQHGAHAHWFGAGGYLWSWGVATFATWQAAFLALLSLVLLSAYFVHRGSRASRDADARVLAQLDRIETRLRALETAATAPWVPPLQRESPLQYMDRDSGI
jgi:hypothetical protein